jgi:hypothetical protein
MGALFQLIQELEDNLKPGCCTNQLVINGGEPKIKLYDTIADACEEAKNFDWYDLEEIVPLNNKIKRVKGIVCHECKNQKCIISLIVDKSENTRFCVVGNIEIKISTNSSIL